MINRKFVDYTLTFTLALLVSACHSVADTPSTSTHDKFFTYAPQTIEPIVSYQDPERITPEMCPYHIDGTPLGLSCLHCEHPLAQMQAQQISEILRNSCRKHVALSVLTDGTFGNNRDFLIDQVRTITQYGAKLHLYVYLSNGPWQRRYGRMPDKGFPKNMSPEEFRNKIRYDFALREEFKSIIKYNEPLLEYALRRGAAIYLMPMLEDNLDYASAREMELLVKQTISPSISYTLGRNPCPRCYKGNDISVPAPLFTDQHITSSDTIITTTQGLVVNDGKDFSFDWEYPNYQNLTFTRLLEFIDDAKLKNNTFIIWNREYQGVSVNNMLNDPDFRDYQLITIPERDLLVDVLRTK